MSKEAADTRTLPTAPKSQRTASAVGLATAMPEHTAKGVSDGNGPALSEGSTVSDDEAALVTVLHAIFVECKLQDMVPVVVAWYREVGAVAGSELLEAYEDLTKVLGLQFMESRRLRWVLELRIGMRAMLGVPNGYLERIAVQLRERAGVDSLSDLNANRIRSRSRSRTPRASRAGSMSLQENANALAPAAAEEAPAAPRPAPIDVAESLSSATTKPRLFLHGNGRNRFSWSWVRHLCRGMGLNTVTSGAAEEKLPEPADCEEFERGVHALFNMAPR